MLWVDGEDVPAHGALGELLMSFQLKIYNSMILICYKNISSVTLKSLMHMGKLSHDTD